MDGFSDNVQYFGLIFARILGLFFTAPVFSTDSVGNRMRIILGFLLAIILYPISANYLPALPNSVLGFALLVMGQIIIGVLIGFMVLVIFSSFQIIGEVLSLQMGISFFVLDPQSQISIPLLGTLKNTIGILLFLAVPFQMDGFYVPALLHMVRAIGHSFQAVPELIPSTQISGGILNYLDQAFAIMFITAVKVGLPLVGILFISSLTLGLLGRAAPQMNLINMGIQINITVGLIVLMTLIPVIVPVMQTSFVLLYDHVGSMLRSWPQGVAP